MQVTVPVFETKVSYVRPPFSLPRLNFNSLSLCLDCKLPFEYCEFSSDWKTCSANLEKVDAELLQKLKDLRIASGKDKPSANAGTESKSAEATKKPAKTADGEGEEEDGEEGEDDENGDEEDEEEEVAEVVKSPAATMKAGKPGVKEITITVKERTRRKFMTIVKGVETCGLKSKDIAKEFSKKFATSASVTADVRR